MEIPWKFYGISIHFYRNSMEHSVYFLLISIDFPENSTEHIWKFYGNKTIEFYVCAHTCMYTNYCRIQTHVHMHVHIMCALGVCV